MNRDALYAKAQSEVLRHRQAAEAEAAQKREELYDLAPALQALDDNIARQGALAAKLMAAGDAEAGRAQLSALGAVQEKRRSLLAQLGLSEDDLAPRYDCAECRDTGRQNGAVCACVHRAVQRLRRQEVNRDGWLAGRSFGNFSLTYYPEVLEGSELSPRGQMEQILAFCRDYATGFLPGSESLYMYGGAGLGKTHLALSIAGAVLEGGHNVVYVSAQEAFSRIEQDRRDWSSTDSLLATMLEADLLVLDDLGTEYLSNYILSCLYQLINTRMGRRATIYTSNIDSAVFLAQRYTDKIASRLLGDCRRLPFLGQDIRLQKNSM